MKTIFELPEFAPFKWVYDQQASRYTAFQRYYHGTMYDQSSFRIAHKLYAGTKALFLPLSRAVDIDVALVPGDWQLAEESAPLQDALNTVFTWSNWLVDGPLYVQFGASMGDVVLKVVDLTDPGRVIIEPVDPSTALLLSTGRWNSTIGMAVVVRREYDTNGEMHEYGEVIEPTRIRTYRDGAPFGYDGREPEYLNALGFVPFVKVQNVNEGLAWGAPTYDKVLPLLDSVNELASYLADVIGRHAEPQWAIAGAEPANLTKSGDNVWFMPQGADIKAILATIDIEGVLAFVNEIKAEMKNGLPELAFDELRAKDQIATASIELQLAELVAKISRMRRSYDAGLAAALVMAGRAAADMGLSDIAPLANGLAFDRQRPVLPQLPTDQIQLRLMEIELEQAEAMIGGEGVPGDIPA